MGGSDGATQAGKVFVELEHARAKENLARSALSRRCVWVDMPVCVREHQPVQAFLQSVPTRMHIHNPVAVSSRGWSWSARGGAFGNKLPGSQPLL